MLVQISTGLAQTSPAAGPGDKPPSKTQALPKNSAHASAQADVTTASFGDWQVVCRMTDAGGGGQPGSRTCEVLQSVMLQGQTTPFAQLGFGRMKPGEPLIFTVVVPVSVSFPSQVSVALDEEDNQPLKADWTRCLPNGCFASAAMSNEILNHWRTSDSGGQLTFQSGAPQDLRLPISFKGLARALDALGKED